ncbi:FG-GAP-like repeat-containing protein [Nostoc sp. XA010]|uniref:FG-GAP-like repeat-containing protein n=1 Tax=Nostoc sp. XA010 TaxID=2780407 RepID=UPI001E6065FE|nr:FG-GAP-like repeat-containing protein [Nostoc sp. XA010]MCC5659361.1 FG-GAP-like repeat-containing protein [Nostoc sp. XA010]
MTTATITKHTLVIIDSAIDDHQILVQGIIPTAKVITLNKHEDGIAQISALSKNHPAASIQIIAHGSPGSLQLGNSQLSLDNLYTYRQQLQQWLAAEILIYGCEVARGETGKTFIEQLHQLTGANIAASAQKIGNAQHGGTWELEVKIGQIGSTLALQPEVKEAYPGVFATFGTATNFTVGSNPQSITVGDFNGDGKLDLAAANVNSNNVSLLLGDGTGGFATATNFTAGSNPRSVTVGDFNGDSKLDLAAANVNSNNVSLLLGNGTGGFATATNFTVGSSPYSITVADFNGDGKLDLAAANFYSNNVSVLLGDGTGGFATATNFTVGSNPQSITVADFNGDGKLDLAAANHFSYNVSVLLGDGTGGFATATNFTVGTNHPVSLTGRDFNSDGKLDLATANHDSDNVSVLLGDGTGGFATATNFTVGSSPQSVTVGDFNGDGKLDLAAANFYSNNVSVLLGDGTGGFATATNFTVGSNPQSVTVADFNGDSKLDLAAANISSNTVSVLLNVNLAPVTTATNTALAYTENDSATIIDPGITITDADSPNLSSATVTITNGFLATEDTLAFNDQNGITGSYTNGVLTLTGSATVADYQTALQSVTYQNSSDNLSTTPRTINFVVNDGSLNSTAVTRDINLTAVNDVPSDLELSANTVNDKATANTDIGTFSSTDPDQNDNFAYSLVSGIDDVDNNAFTIDSNSLKINNSPDFKTKSSYKIRVRTTDDGNLTFEKGLTINVNNNVETPSRLTNPNDDVFNITSEDIKAKLEIKLTGHSSKLVNELGLFTVDDAKGTINGIAPGAEGYAKAALDRSEVILSAIANIPNGFDTNNLTTLLELNSGQSFRFLLVQDGTLDGVRYNPNSIGKLLFSSVSTQKITDLGDDGFSLGWKDASGNSATDFNDLVVKIKQTDQALPLGTNLQNKFQGEVIDLRDVKQSVNAKFNVYREASYNNYVGFYQVTDENGGIDTNGDGNADILTGQAGYTQAAVRGRVAGIDLSVSNQGSATYSGTFQPGAIFVPFIIVNGSPDALLDNNSNNDPAVYFPFLGANSDQSDHIRLLASNTFGFEDLPGGGDRDFNDVIIKANLTTTI